MANPKREGFSIYTSILTREPLLLLVSALAQDAGCSRFLLPIMLPCQCPSYKLMVIRNANALPAERGDGDVYSLFFFTLHGNPKVHHSCGTKNVSFELE